MKKLKVLFGAAMIVASLGFAKAQKVATADVEGILNLMPEKKKADEQIMAILKTKQAEIEKQSKDLENKFKKYQEEAPKQTKQVNEQRTAEVQKLQQRLQEMQQAAQKDYTEKQQAAYAPIDKKLSDAITKVAKAKGYEFIFDVNTVGLIYKGGADATADVKKELGL